METLKKGDNIKYQFGNAVPVYGKFIEYDSSSLNNRFNKIEVDHCRCETYTVHTESITKI